MKNINSGISSHYETINEYIIPVDDKLDNPTLNFLRILFT